MQEPASRYQKFIAQSEGVELHDVSAQLLHEEGLQDRRRRVARTVLAAINNAIFITFINLARFGYTLLPVTRIFLASASIPMELFNTAVHVLKMIQKRKPLMFVALAIGMGLAASAVMLITDLVQWFAKPVAVGLAASTKAAMVSTATSIGTMTAIAATGPYVFTAILGAFAVKAVFTYIRALVNYVSDKKAAKQNKTIPLTTPLQKAGLVTKFVRAAAFLTVASMIAPYMVLMVGVGAAAANPVGAAILLGFMVTALATLVAIKIIKKVHEMQTIKKTTETLVRAKKDPYELLDVNAEHLAARIQHDKENKHSFLTSPLKYLKRLWENLKAPKGVKDPLGSAIYLEERYQTKMKDPATPEADKALIRDAYDVIKKGTGRAAYIKYKAVAEQKIAAEQAAVVPAVSVVSAENSAESIEKLRQEGLRSEQFNAPLLSPRDVAARERREIEQRRADEAAASAMKYSSAMPLLNGQ